MKLVKPTDEAKADQALENVVLYKQRRDIDAQQEALDLAERNKDEQTQQNKLS